MSIATGGLYVHLPWCVRKCPYCDFNSYEARGELAEQAYVDALLRDLDYALERAGPLVIESIFIGGGTPSLFGGAAIGALLDGIAGRARLAPGLEVTLEANPGASEAARLRDYVLAGVNRISLGIQSFNDDRLRAIGRIHDSAAGLRAVERARAAGVANLNLDLMFGLPGDEPGDGLLDLEQAIALAPEHISWYQLTIEEGTAFARKPPALPEHDQICDDYDAGLARLAAAGYAQYEVSAYARAGRQSRHNLNYWRFGDYLGIGAGAHGKQRVADGIVRSVRVRHPDSYLKAARDGRPVASETAVRGIALATEFMLNALRLRDGFSLAEFVQRTGLPADSIGPPLEAARARGWLVQDADTVRPTAQGYRFLNELLLLFMDLPEPIIEVAASRESIIPAGARQRRHPVTARGAGVDP